MDNRGKVIDFGRAVEMNSFTEDAVRKLFDASMELAKEIIERDPATHTENEKTFVAAHAKFAVAMLVTSFTKPQA